MTLTRRAVMASAACFAATAPTAGLSQSSPAIHVLKDPNCGCCTAWIEILKENGFKVTTERSFGTLLIRHKLECQSAANRDPLSASKNDPLGVPG